MRGGSGDETPDEQWPLPRALLKVGAAVSCFTASEHRERATRSGAGPWGPPRASVSGVWGDGGPPTSNGPAAPSKVGAAVSCFTASEHASEPRERSGALGPPRASVSGGSGDEVPHEK